MCTDNGQHKGEPCLENTAQRITKVDPFMSQSDLFYLNLHYTANTPPFSAFFPTCIWKCFLPPGNLLKLYKAKLSSSWA